MQAGHAVPPVDAAGRRSPLGRWLGQAGTARPASWRAECGVAYFSRHYRVRPGAELPGSPATRILAGLSEFTAGIWGADNGTMQFAIAPLAADQRFAPVRDQRVFTVVLRTLPAFARWLDGLDPITDVFTMAGLHNTLRRLVVDGRPVVTGLHAVGDCVCTTNPTLGRGLSLAISGAADLTDTIAAHGRNWADQALAKDSRVVAHAQLRAAAEFDSVAFRGLWGILAMIRQPEEVYRDPRIVARTQETLREHGSTTAAPPQPTREQLQLALASASAAGPRTA